jgi:hypothetical protein
MVTIHKIRCAYCKHTEFYNNNKTGCSLCHRNYYVSKTKKNKNKYSKEKAGRQCLSILLLSTVFCIKR